MPEHCCARRHAKRHLIRQRFKRGPSATRIQKMNVRPRPEIPVPVSTVMALHSKSQRLTAKYATIQHNLARERRIRMRRPRESNPTLAAQFRAKSRTVSQIPANSLPLNFKAPPAFVLPDSVPLNLQKKRTRTTPAQSCVPQSCLVRSRALQIRTVQLFTARTKFLNRKSLYPSLRPPVPRKPS